MEDGRKFQVTLPPDLADAVERKVASGEFNSAEDVLREGVQVLFERDEPVERWLRDVVLPAHAEYLADPTNVIDGDDILAVVQADYEARKS